MAKTVAGKPIEECFNCWAKGLDDNRYSKTLDGGTKEKPISHWGDSAKRHRTKTWGDPLKWNKKAAAAEYVHASESVLHDAADFALYQRPRVFALSMGDWLDDKVPIEWLADMLRVIHETPHLDWLLLTKRPQNWRKRIQDALCSGFHCMEISDWLGCWLAGLGPLNVWIGVSAGADQAAALDIPARVHFLSCEPMLRPLAMTDGRCPDCGYTKDDVAMQMDHRLCNGPGPKGFDWVIFGGESGSKARECNVDWIRDGVQFCRDHNIAPFVKQLGSNLVFPSGQKIKLHDSHGGDMDEWPAHLRVREFPVVRP